MWTPDDTGVLLQRIETPGSTKVIIKLVRQQPDDSVSETTMTLLIKTDGAEEYELDFDPWSDMNVNKDQSIDEKDVDAITKLALAFYRQPIIGPGYGAFLSLEPEELVEIFDPAKPVIPVAPPKIRVQIEVLDLEEGDQPTFDYFLSAVSFDDGESFTVRRINPHTGFIEFPELDSLVKSFIKLKL